MGKNRKIQNRTQHQRNNNTTFFTTVGFLYSHFKKYILAYFTSFFSFSHNIITIFQKTSLVHKNSIMCAISEIYAINSEEINKKKRNIKSVYVLCLHFFYFPQTIYLGF